MISSTGESNPVGNVIPDVVSWTVLRMEFQSLANFPKVAAAPSPRSSQNAAPASIFSESLFLQFCPVR